MTSLTFADTEKRIRALLVVQFIDEAAADQRASAAPSSLTHRVPAST